MEVLDLFFLHSRLSFWRRVSLRTQTGLALDYRSTGVDVCDLPSRSHKNDLGAQTCSSLCLFNRLRLCCDEHHLYLGIITRYAVSESNSNLLP